MRSAFEQPLVSDGRMFLCKERRDASFPFLWHHHKEFELTLITASRGQRFVGDHIGAYQSGDLVLLGPNLPHTWSSSDEFRGKHTAVVIQFDEDIFGKKGVGGLSPGPFRRFIAGASRGYAFAGAQARAVAERIQRLADLSPVRQLGELLHVLEDLVAADGTPLSSRAVVPNFRADVSHPIDGVCRFINEHYREPIALADVASVAGMSASTFCRFFKRTTSRTFTDYVNEIRIGHACRLLVETERSIADIAQDAGFTNLSNFNQRFLATKTLRPSAYRKAFRGSYGSSRK